MTKICFEKPDGTMGKDAFRTLMNKAGGFEQVPSNSKDWFLVTYEGVQYHLGEGATGRTSSSNSKKDNLHKISVLTSIATHVNKGDTVMVAVGCPLSVYPDEKARAEYMDYVLPKGRVEISVNGTDTYFYVTKRFCFPESFGIVFAEPQRFENNYAGVIDLGGLNINASAYQNGSIVPECSFTGKLGSETILRQLQSELDERLDSNFNMMEIECFVSQGYVTNAQEETEDFFRSFFEGHLEKVEESCTNKRWNLKYMNLVFIGGTSQLLKQYIIKKYPNAYIPDNAEWANAEGYYKMLSKM